MNTTGQILCHFARFNGIDTGLFQCTRKMGQLRCVVQFCTMLQTSCPGIDRCNRIGRCRLTFLMLTVKMERNRLVFCLFFLLYACVIIKITDNDASPFHEPPPIQLFCHRDTLILMSSCPTNHNPGQWYPIVRHRHSSCMPTQIHRTTSEPAQPYRQSNDVRTKFSDHRTASCSSCFIVRKSNENAFLWCES